MILKRLVEEILKSMISNGITVTPEVLSADLLRLKDFSYTATGLDQAKTYRFHVRARNACNYGPISGHGNGDLRAPPKQMDALDVSMSPV